MVRPEKREERMLHAERHLPRVLHPLGIRQAAIDTLDQVGRCFQAKELGRHPCILYTDSKPRNANNLTDESDMLCQDVANVTRIGA